MKKVIRLDKYLADMGVGTRAEVKSIIQKRKVKVNGMIETMSNRKISFLKDKVELENKVITYLQNEYYMLNKPAGVVSATSDLHCKTVMDCIIEANRKDLFPVGRLDKDTEGLLLITNDGILAHNLLSPKKHVAKVYYAKIDGMVTEEDIHSFEKGILIEPDVITRPAQLTIIKSGSRSEVELTIFEGKFHQVKRMFYALGKEVLYLKRLSMGNLMLDKALRPGQYRKLTKEELKKIDITLGKE